jgi:hypothetical protein
VTKAELQELLSDCPTLFHMAQNGSWPSIKKHGLLSTSALLDAAGLRGVARRRIESERRPENVTIQGKLESEVVIRDQKPMDDKGLLRCLQDGLTPAQWYRLLNHRVFFWLTRDRLHRLLSADAYRESEHDVLEVDTASLVSQYRRAITLCPMNSGCTKPMPHPRGRRTFSSIRNYPYSHWRSRRKRGERVVELAVTDGVPDIHKYVRRVLVMKGTSVLSTLWTATKLARAKK